ncbi:unnamed protein product, partial [Symbiodinium pilosum]
AYMSRYELSRDEVLEQKQAFDLLDIDGNGKVTYQEVKEMNAKLGQPMSEQELSEQFTTLDVDGNNTVTFPEFLKVYVKGEFGREVPLPRGEETLQVNDLAPGRAHSMSNTLDPIDESKMIMKLSQKNSASYYVRVAKVMLAGSQEKPASEVLELNALGYAIPQATAVAALLEEQQIGKAPAIGLQIRGFLAPPGIAWRLALDVAGDIPAGRDWAELVEAGYLDVDWRDVEFPVGSLELPRSLRRGEAKTFLACKIALGRASMVKDGNPPKFPEFFASCLVRSQASLLAARARGADHADPVADWQQVYRVRHRDQVLPFALCEVVFEERRAIAKPLICEYCEQRAASVYCKNDNAHFCAACDASHHSENEFFARHQRFALEHSPLQFGLCRHHPSERYESVCLQCKVMLCRMCNKFGDHARKEHEGHTLMSTVEAFQQAMQAGSESDSEQGRHNSILQEVMQDRHFQLMEVHANFEETQGQMDVVLRGALDQLERAQSRKLEFLQSMKRQVTTQLLFIQWLDNFQAHCRMALPPADFVVATRRHEGLLAALFGSDGSSVLKVGVKGAVVP